MKLGTSQQMHQQMKLSPQMIQTVSLMALPISELRERIYEEAEKNPALEIINDKSEAIDVRDFSHKNDFTFNAKLSSNANSEASDNFQTFLESRPAREETLQEHLLAQVSVMPFATTERHLIEKIIANLDEKGFHHVSPESLLDAAFPEETPSLLNKCLEIVRQLDPVGTACYSVQESLQVQARLSGNAPPLATFLLEHHFRLLENPRATMILKKLSSFPTVMLHGIEINLEKVEEAIDFIKTLDPKPARQFSSNQVVFVSPDVIIEKVYDDESEKSYKLKIILADAFLPEVIISPVFEKVDDSPINPEKKSSMQNLQVEEQRFIKESLKSAQWFISAIEQRKKTLLKVVKVIISRQKAFFDKGPRFLAPLRLKDVASEIGVHETTVSRITNSKYMRCDWGFFELKYFFSNESGGRKSEILTAPSDVGGGSKESVKQELKLLLEDQERINPNKKLSDAKISAMLAEKGIIIARRTVAKYRAELSIHSSYQR